MALVKSLLSTGVIKKCNFFLGRVQKFNSNIEKRKYEPDKLDDGTKLIETLEDGK